VHILSCVRTLLGRFAHWLIPTLGLTRTFRPGGGRTTKSTMSMKMKRMPKKIGRRDGTPASRAEVVGGGVAS
jgi:hypothetical protein